MKQHQAISRRELGQEIERQKKLGKRIVFTNGCFDLLHVGHIRCLRQARLLGDLLVVGLNSDKSVTRIKGPRRPIIPEAERAEMIAALACVDYVTIFDEDTPEELIKVVSPDILVKGGDWQPSKVVGRQYVEDRGGKVVTVPLAEGYSTSRLMERIASLVVAGKERL